ncbi:type I-E CRISPR-associated endoribonuclease Cas2e, partial [Cutibacterium acnes]|nr:type I-E CRISPR-associated endoribonuclease Cas2e [Cutibacterium acnes]
MTVLVLTACPADLRGHLTRWLLEISPGVFVGHVPARVRDALWDRVIEMRRDGRAILVYTVRGEQHFEFRVHRHDWEVVDFDGLKL